MTILLFSSVQFSHSVLSNSLQPHESQHARPPCPSPTPRVHSNSCPSSPRCHPAISSSVVPFSLLPPIPASESFPMSQLFTWGGQSTGVSALALVITHCLFYLLRCLTTSHISSCCIVVDVGLITCSLELCNAIWLTSLPSSPSSTLSLD